MTETLAVFCPEVRQKAELANDEHGYLSREVSKQSVEGATWFLLAPYRKYERKEIS